MALHMTPSEFRELLRAAFDEGFEHIVPTRRFYEAVDLGFNKDMPIPNDIGDDDSLIDLVSRLRNIMKRKQ